MPRLEEDPSTLPLVIVSDRPMSENLTGNWRSLRPRIRAADCTGCNICWKFCPEACVRRTDKVPEIDFHYCKGCGVCVEECPQECVEFLPEAAAEVAA